MRIAAGIRGTKRAHRLSLIAAIGIGAMAFTGCSAINEQSTTRVYSASDGVLLDLGQLELRNVMVVSEAANAPGRVAGTFYNDSAEDITLTITGAAGSETEIVVKPGVPTILGTDGDEHILSSVANAPGAMEPLELRTSGAASETATLNVPVMDGTLKEYKNLIPTPAPSAEPSMATETATAVETAEATTAP